MQRIDPAAKALATLGIALVLATGLPSVADAEVITAAGYLRKMAAKSTSDIATGSTSSSYANIEHGSVTFTSTVVGPVLVTFCSDVLVSSSEWICLRAKLDGVILGEYQDNQFAQDTGGFVCEQWFAPAVPAGQHTVRLRWKVSGGGAAWLYKRTLTVQYSK